MCGPLLMNPIMSGKPIDVRSVNGLTRHMAHALFQGGQERLVVTEEAKPREE